MLTSTRLTVTVADEESELPAPVFVACTTSAYELMDRKLSAPLTAMAPVAELMAKAPFTLPLRIAKDIG